MKRRIGLSLLALVLVGCATATDDAAPSSTTILEPPTSTSLSTTTTQATTTTSLTTTTTAFPPTDFECPPVLVRGQDTVRIDAECSVIPLGVEPTVDMAHPLLFDDLAGGLVFQTDQRVIWWQGVGAAEPKEMVVAADDEFVILQDVAHVGGDIEVWFNRARGFTIDDSVEILERVVIAGGEPTVVAETGGWESGSTVTIGGEVIAYEHGAEGFYSFGVTDLQMGTTDWASQPWNPYSKMEFEDTFAGCEGCPVGLIVSDDGRLVAYRGSGGDSADIAVLVVVDLESGEETRVEIPGFRASGSVPETGPFVSGLDLLGDLALVNGSDDLGQPLVARWVDLFDDGADWAELPFRGDARFLRSDVQFGESESG